MCEKALQIIKEEKCPRVIDIGCGPGQFANLLFDNEIVDYKGIDFSSEAIKLAKLRNEKYSDLFFIDDAYMSNIYYGDYNIAILFEVLEHIQDDLRILRKIRSGAKVLFSVPNFQSKSHIRVFNNGEEIINRYNNIIEIDKIYTFNISDVNKLFLVVGTIR